MSKKKSAVSHEDYEKVVEAAFFRPKFDTVAVVAPVGVTRGFSWEVTYNKSVGTPAGAVRMLEDGDESGPVMDLPDGIVLKHFWKKPVVRPDQFRPAPDNEEEYWTAHAEMQAKLERAFSRVHVSVPYGWLPVLAFVAEKLSKIDVKGQDFLAKIDYTGTLSIYRDFLADADPAIALYVDDLCNWAQAVCNDRCAVFGTEGQKAELNGDLYTVLSLEACFMPQAELKARLYPRARGNKLENSPGAAMAR